MGREAAGARLGLRIAGLDTAGRDTARRERTAAGRCTTGGRLTLTGADRLLLAATFINRLTAPSPTLIPSVISGACGIEWLRWGAADSEGSTPTNGVVAAAGPKASSNMDNRHIQNRDMALFHGPAKIKL